MINILIIIIGLASGAFVSAGVFGLITTIGVIPRLADTTHTASHVMSYEQSVLYGAVAGNIFLLFPIYISLPLADIVFVLMGIFFGLFVGCLVTALSECVLSTSVFGRRMRLHQGIGFITLSVAIGKMLGSLIFFYFEFY